MGKTPWLDEFEGGFGEAMTVDLQFDAVMAGVVAAGGEVAQGLLFGEVERGVGGEGQLGPFENFLGGATVGFDVVDNVVDDEVLRFVRGGGDGGGEGEGLTESEGGGADGESGGGAGFLAEAEKRQGLGMAALDEGAAGVFGDPLAVVGCGDVPGVEFVEHPLGMVLGDVVEVVSDGFTDVERGIVAEGIQDAASGLGILHQGLKTESPGQAGT